MNENDMNDIINNFKNMLQNNEATQKDNSIDSNTQNNNQDSNLNISPEMLTNLMNTFKATSSKESNSNTSEENFSSNIDLDTILKIKTIMETLNKKDDPRSNLLYSLKPYLRESRKKKLDQYVNLFKITQVTSLFKNEKGDAK